MNSILKIGDDVYHIAQICINGHVINAYLNSLEDNKGEFCQHCGKRTIINCEKCNNPIIGWKYNPHVNMLVPFSAPNFCLFCGKPYPWTKSKIKALKELIDFENKLDQDEKKILKKNINDIINESPRTKVASIKFKQGLSKIGKETAKAVRDIIVDIASTTAKKIILGEV
jgi:hypothetical protein